MLLVRQNFVLRHVIIKRQLARKGFSLFLPHLDSTSFPECLPVYRLPAADLTNFGVPCFSHDFPEHTRKAEDKFYIGHVQAMPQCFHRPISLILEQLLVNCCTWQIHSQQLRSYYKPNSSLS